MLFSCAEGTIWALLRVPEYVGDQGSVYCRAKNPEIVNAAGVDLAVAHCLYIDSFN